MVVGEDSIS